MSKFASPRAYRAALEARIIAERKSGEDVSRLRKKVAFDAALARLYTADCGLVLKGGYALELRLETPRATKDLDFVTKQLFRASLGKEDSSEALRAAVETSLLSKTQTDDDYFEFTVGEAMADLAGGGGGYRYPIECRLDGRRFENFHVDISLGDFVADKNDQLERVSKARISADRTARYKAELVTKDQHFAEKIHAYTLPRDGVNSRARDLVDMVLLIKDGIDAKKTKTMIQNIFGHRKTHEIPNQLVPPPQTWSAAYAKLAEECLIDLSLDEAFENVRKYFDNVWDPATQSRER